MNQDQLDLLAALMTPEELERAIKHYPYSLPDKAIRFMNEDDLVRQVTASGSHYFSQATMKAFGCKINELYGRRYLVTSDKHPDGRVYRVIYFYDHPTTVPEGTVLKLQAEKLGWFMGSGALSKARNLAKLLSQTFPYMCTVGSATDTPCPNLAGERSDMCGDHWHRTGPIGD